ncbi:MAG TPA: 4-hydroxy-tetrahydrodipicolinate synthase [Bacteroidetes bacterium]|nr:4-hydroxy-tetrahydrodipicolinate synthase [Bacteroidota bacterium]
MENFMGTGVAIVTPFKSDTSIDFNAFGKVVEHVIEGGVNYIVGLGTTGEATTLSKIEKQAVITFLADSIGKRVPLVIGIGGNNTQEIINFIKETDLSGVDAILSVAPYYNKPAQRGLYMHFKTIAGATTLPVIIYNVPGRTCSNISAETCIELAKTCENIVGVKEASGNLKQIMEIIRNKPKNFLVISGDDSLTIPIIAVGGSGLISVIGNAYPSQVSSIVSQALKGNLKIARETQFKLLEMTDLMFAEGNPAGIKALLSSMGLIDNVLRLPLVTVSDQLMEKIIKAGKVT